MGGQVLDTNHDTAGEVVDPGFLRQVAKIPEGETNQLCDHFPQKLHKMKKIEPRLRGRGVCASCVPLMHSSAGYYAMCGP